MLTTNTTTLYENELSVPFANNGANPQICYMPMLHDMSPWNSQTHLKVKMWLLPFKYLSKKFQNSLPLIPVRNYAMILCNDFILFSIFRTTWCSFKGPCDIKSFKIATAYAVWFSRYRPSNLLITADFALLLVFIIFMWVVCAIWKTKTQWIKGNNPH